MTKRKNAEKNMKLNVRTVTSLGNFIIALLLLLDQGAKILAYSYLRGNSDITLIPGVLELKYLENRGMAFGMLQGRIPVLIALCVIFFLAFLYFYIRVPKNTYYLPLIFISFVMLSGALGNFIDRAFRGFVVDFIYFSLIDFPVFNLADIYVVCSGIMLVLFVCLKYKDEDFAFLGRR